MRYGIFSDVHSNLEALQAVIKAYRNEAIDKYLCVGDVVGYAASPNECIDKVKMLALITVAGNHDWAAVGQFCTDYFRPVAKEAILWTRRIVNDHSRNFLRVLKPVYKNEDLTLVHGTLDNPEYFNYLTDGNIAQGSFRLLETDICFVGHTHLAGIFIQDRDNQLNYCRASGLSIQEGNKYIVNVGSVGQPRDGDHRASYCIYDSEKKEVLMKRANYDMEKAREKILEAGLPKFLGDRLLAGK